MKLYIAEGDDTFYDCGHRWIVGVYSTQALADAAVDADEAAYNDTYGAYLGYTVTETTLDKPYER
jgi:hypothetical protein